MTETSVRKYHQRGDPGAAKRQGQIVVCRRAACPCGRPDSQNTVVAGTAAGLAGGIFAFSKGSVFPDTLAIPNSVDALVMVLLGGLHAPAGPVLGAGVFALLEDFLSRLPYWRALLGAAVVAIAVFAPGGIGGALAAWLDRRRGRPA